MKEPDYWLQAKAAAEAMVKKYGYSDQVKADAATVDKIRNALSTEKAPAVSDESPKSSDDVTP